MDGCITPKTEVYNLDPVGLLDLYVDIRSLYSYKLCHDVSLLTKTCAQDKIVATPH